MSKPSIWARVFLGLSWLALQTHGLCSSLGTPVELCWPLIVAQMHSHPRPQPSAWTVVPPAPHTPTHPITSFGPLGCHLLMVGLPVLSKVSIAPPVPSLRFILHCTFQQHYKIYKSNKNINYKNQITFWLFPCCRFGRQNAYPPKDVHALIPGPVVVMLHGKRDFAAVIMELKIGRLSWIIREAQSNHGSP